jgi:dienelactone hydrolase
MDDEQVFLGQAGQLLYELAQGRARPWSFAHRGGRSPKQWQKRARDALLDVMGCRFDPVDLDVRQEGCLQREGYEEHRISFASTSLHRVAGVVLVPESAAPPYAAVVALHDHGGFFLYGKEKIVEQPNECQALRDFKRRCYGGRSWASELARRGYLVAAVDALGWGERGFHRPSLRDPQPLDDVHCESVERTHLRNEPNPPAASHLHLHAGWAGISWGGVISWDDRRSVDYLLSRGDVDPQRIACIGLSGGGFRSTYLFGSDPRIAVAGIIGWMTRLSEQLLHSHGCHLGMFNPPAVGRVMDHPDVAALGAPRPLFVQQCARDNLYPKWGMEQAVADIAAAYDAWKAGEAFRAKFYDVPHCFEVPMQEEMFTWLDDVVARQGP